jgi:hypothetical protein
MATFKVNADSAFRLDPRNPATLPARSGAGTAMPRFAARIAG